MSWSGKVLQNRLKDKREEGPYHQHQNHGTLVDVVRVDTGSLPEPTPETSQRKDTSSNIVLKNRARLKELKNQFRFLHLDYLEINSQHELFP